MTTSEDGIPSDEDERIDKNVLKEEQKAVPIWDKPKEEEVIEVAQELPPPPDEESVVPMEEGNNDFDWGFGNASKSKKGRRKPKGIPVDFAD